MKQPSVRLAHWTVTPHPRGVMAALFPAPARGSTAVRVLVLLAALALASWVLAATPGSELHSNWAVEEGYSLRVLASGFSLPTSLAAVPHPAQQPQAPKLFVAELRGAIKVVANDNSVSELARIPTLTPRKEWPDWEGEAGMAGICLDPEHGYVFTTYAYRDATGVLRNGISRLRLEPHTFAGKVQEQSDLGQFLASAPSALSHQIGNCVVHGGYLHVSIADAGYPAQSEKLDSPLGKVLRLTLDGAPAPGNPFGGQGPIAPRVYVSGLRNPFGIAFAGDRLFAAENGISLDRFLELQPGRNYQWNGSDSSIAINAAAVFVPTIGPAQMVYAAPVTGGLRTSEHDRFLIAASNGGQGPGVVALEYSRTDNTVIAAPRHLVRYEGHREGMAVAGVALIAEGLAFAPILPVDGAGAVLVARYEPSAAHDAILGKSAANLIAAKNCLGCHSLEGVGGRVGPSLDLNSLRTRVETRVLNAAYAQQLARLDLINDPVVAKGRDARQEVLAAAPDDRVRVWVINRLLNPKFDQPDAQMPDLNLDRGTAEALARDLVGASGWKQRLAKLMSDKHFMQGAALGASAVGMLAVLLLVVWLVLHRFRARARP